MDPPCSAVAPPLHHRCRVFPTEAMVVVKTSSMAGDPDANVALLERLLSAVGDD